MYKQQVSILCAAVLALSLGLQQSSGQVTVVTQNRRIIVSGSTQGPGGTPIFGCCLPGPGCTLGPAGCPPAPSVDAGPFVEGIGSGIGLGTGCPFCAELTCSHATAVQSSTALGPTASASGAAFCGLEFACQDPGCFPNPCIGVSNIITTATAQSVFAVTYTSNADQAVAVGWELEIPPFDPNPSFDLACLLANVVVSDVLGERSAQAEILLNGFSLGSSVLNDVGLENELIVHFVAQNQQVEITAEAMTSYVREAGCASQFFGLTLREQTGNSTFSLQQAFWAAVFNPGTFQPHASWLPAFQELDVADPGRLYAMPSAFESQNLNFSVTGKGIGATVISVGDVIVPDTPIRRQIRFTDGAALGRSITAFHTGEMTIHGDMILPAGSHVRILGNPPVVLLIGAAGKVVVDPAAVLDMDPFSSITNRGQFCLLGGLRSTEAPLPTSRHSTATATGCLMT